MGKVKDQLEELFTRYREKRICVLGTTCCGKSTLQQCFSQSVDMDEVLWTTLTKEEETYICSKPWTNDIGRFTSKIVKERMVIEPGHPLFSLILLECDMIVYLEISDGLLREHCNKRSASFEDAKNVKLAIEKAIDEKRADTNIKVFILSVDE
ncbi:MAG: hypothetical protein RR533_10095 [Carnobacterium sp.]